MISIKSRSSLRGLKKCHGCGKYNGIRAEICKNKTCTLSIKFNNLKKKPFIDPVQLILNTEYKLYSVRIRDRGPELRNFVKITDKTISSDDSSSIISRNAICFIDTCKYDSNDINISCKHVKNATNSLIKSTIMEIDEKVLLGMNILSDIQTKLWKLYCDNKVNAPVVQRISKSVFTVKCEITTLFPTGYLHVYLTGGDLKSEAKYSCACKKIKISLTPNDSVVVQHDNCDHLFLVMAAIMSNETTLKEFSKHLNIFLKSDEIIISSPTNNNSNENNEILLNSVFDNSFHDLSEADVDFSDSLKSTGNGVDQISMGDFIDCSLGGPMDVMTNYDSYNLEGLELTDCQIELMDQFKLTDHIDLCQSEIEFTEADLLSDSLLASSIYCENDATTIEVPSSDSNNKTKNNTLSNSKKKKKIVLKRDEGAIPTGMEFHNWLDSVIERINFSMNFNCSGNVENLTFIVPNDFFEYFRTRFSIGSKKRLPNNTQLIQTGKYSGLSMHTWKFYRIEFLKKIFSTENIQLDIERKFNEKSKGNYELIESAEDIETISKYCKIQPSVFKTFLKVGHSSENDETKCGVFSIDWIPNVLKKSKFGEMRLSFKFGHKKNNNIINKPYCYNSKEIINF